MKYLEEQLTETLKISVVRRIFKGYLSGLAYVAAAEAERFKRQRKLGRIFPDKPVAECRPATKFIMPKAGKIFNDPFKQAEYAYSLIESEVEK